MHKRYYLWGLGGVGKRAVGYLAPLGILDGIIDSDITKAGQTINGLTIYDYDTAKPFLKDAGVIIAHFRFEETEAVLERDGIEFYRLGDFITAWYWNSRRENAIGFLDFIITTRCTLNCKDCMQYIPYRPHEDIPLTRLKNDLQKLFSRVSFVGEISIIGGEPFMYENFTELLDYIVQNFSKRVGSVVITTNGTITPDAKLLELCKQTGIRISISDYTNVIPQLEGQISQLESAAALANVKTERKRWSWSKPGRFDAEDYVKSNEKDNTSATCGQTHMQLHNGRLWRCTLMAAGNAAGFCDVHSLHDYYDLSHECNETMHRFTSEHSPRTSQCKRCWFPHKIAVPVAIQETAQNHKTASKTQ